MSAARPDRSKPKTRHRVYIVDDHPIVRHGIAQLIDQQPDLEVCGEAEGAHEALKAIAALKPDVVTVDLSLKGGHGLDLIKDVRERFPRLPVLVVSMHDESLYAERVLRAGARGYIMKHEATDRVAVAIRQVLRGEIYVSDRMASRIMQKIVRTPEGAAPSFLASLSDRELEVFHLIGQGHGTRQIADRLHLSVKTIETYRAHIKDKLNLGTATELVRHAVQWAQGGGASDRK